jgi:hypothetical protein
MKSKTILVSLVAIFALAILATGFASANVQIRSVEMAGVEISGTSSADFSGFAGQVVPVKVVFYAEENASDVRLKSWIAGASGLTVSTERFEVIEGKTYVRYFNLQIPSKVDPTEQLQLVVDVESERGIIGGITIDFTVQRESYVVDVLDVNMDSKVVAGDTLSMNIVLKNKGMRLAEDTFVKVKIPALGVEQKAYFGDLSPVDQTEPLPEKEDAAERSMAVKIPASAKPGIYTVEIEAYNGDSTTTVSKKIAIVGASEDSMAVSSVKSKTFSTGGSAEYSLTLVNSGSKVKIYEITATAPTGLSVEVDQPLVAIPAGSSSTVKLKATSSQVGTYNFDVSVQSNGDLVKKESFVANVEKGAASTAIGGNTTVLLTVVLAIIFVVLLVVLIVLLTRKPEKTREFGESYY